MGKAIDALYNAMLTIKADGSKFLDIDFMSSIFSKVYNDGPLQPLEDYMTHMFGELCLFTSRCIMSDLMPSFLYL